MAADKLKKLEARGRMAFLQGDITAATRYFAQALEEYGGREKRPEKLEKTESERAEERRSRIVASNTDEKAVWVLKKSPSERRKKIPVEKSKVGNKLDNDIMSGIEILDSVIAEAETSIKSFPNYPLSYLRKASALILLNQWDEARKTYVTGISRCTEKTILKSALLSLNNVYKITTCAADLNIGKLPDLINQNGLNATKSLPSTPTLRRNKFRLQSQRRLTKKIFHSSDDDISRKVTSVRYRRRNSSSTDTHF